MGLKRRSTVRFLRKYKMVKSNFICDECPKEIDYRTTRLKIYEENGFVVFETNYMDDLYSVIVPTLDGAMVFTVCFYVVTVISTDIVKRRREV